ncbi:MAG: acyltransferase [Lysobacteraceae bacterium]
MNRGHVFGLDLIRALAVLMVLFTHACFLFVPVTPDLSALDPVLLPGQLGVELFFVLSGFLIGGILADEAERGRLEIRRFWLRRWLRTLPNYYLFLLLNVVLERLLSGHWPDAWRYTVFWQNLAWPNPAFYPESWSLAVEEIFYLVAPVLILLGESRFGGWMRRRGLSPIALIIAGIAVFTAIRIGYVMQLDPGWDEGVRKVTLVRLDAIAYGVLAIVAVRRFRPGERAVKLIALAGAAGVAICVTSFLTLSRDTDLFARTLLFNLIPLSFAAFLPLAGRAHGTSLPSAIRAPVGKLALWSYALYVSHLFVLRILMDGLGWRGSSFGECLLQALAFSVLAIAFSALVYRFHERPWLRLRDHVAPKQPSRLAQPPD